ncbi:tRNA pseudouridine(55) synthase TruB, partial [Streptococcus suis]
MITGIINLKKEAGMTSHDAVFRLRRLLREKKIGHGGTLDP